MRHSRPFPRPALLLFPAGLIAGVLLAHWHPRSGLVATPARALAPAAPPSESRAGLPPLPAAIPAPTPRRGVPGVYDATITRVIDGDTVEARVSVWLGQEVATRVRLRGIDAPERHAPCASEQDRAERASAALARLVEGQAVRLAAVGPDKYFGRVVAEIRLPDGREAGAVLLAEGLARPYGGGRRVSGC